MGRHAVLIAVTVEFSESHSVAVGDFLSSVNGLSTTLLSASAMESVLDTNIESFEVVTKLIVATRQVTKLAVARRQTYQIIPQAWDYENPCAFCGYVYLESDKLRTQCCMSGRALDTTFFPTLLPLPPLLDNLARNRINHMSSNSTYYNNVLSLGAVRKFICV